MSSSDVERVRQLTGITMGQIQARNHLKQRQALAGMPDPRWQQADTIPVPLPVEVAHSQQPGAPVAPTLADRMEPMPQPWTWRDSLRAISVVLLIVGAVALLTACGGGDASEEEIADNTATTQPVACAASGCAR